MSEDIVERGNVKTLFSIGNRIKRTKSIVVVDFLDINDLDEGFLVSSVALEEDTVRELIIGLNKALGDNSGE